MDYTRKERRKIRKEGKKQGFDMKYKKYSRTRSDDNSQVHDRKLL